MPKGSPDDHEKSAAGLDFEEDPIRNGTVLDAIEELLPVEWREQIQAYPLIAVGLGIGVGIWLGMKKSDEIIAAGSALVTSAAMANVSQVMDKVKGGA